MFGVESCMCCKKRWKSPSTNVWKGIFFLRSLHMANQLSCTDEIMRTKKFTSVASVWSIMMQIHIACSLLNCNDLCNNLSPQISSIYKTSICVVQAKKRTWYGYSIVLVAHNEGACCYFSSDLHFKWQLKKARLFRAGRRPHQQTALPSNHIEAERAGGKEGAQSMHTILHMRTYSLPGKVHVYSPYLCLMRSARL